jgi:hypothetical protein
MQRTLADVLRGLEEATAFAKSFRFEMTGDYVALIALIEAMPQNQSGSDKTGVWPGLRAYTKTFTHVRPLRYIP